MRETDQELMDLLETARDVDGPVEYEDNVIPFLTRFEIKPGEDKVPLSILYKLYKTYVKEPVTKHSFTKRVNTVLIQEGRRPRTFYQLNVTAMAISKQYYNILMEGKTNALASSKVMKQFEDFTDRYELREGNVYTTTQTLYALYKLSFQRNGRKPAMSTIKFLEMLKFNFKYKLQRGRYWFAVNERYKGFISPEEIEKVRKGGEKTRRYTNKEKGQDKEVGHS